MNMRNDTTFQILIDGKRRGSPGRWHHRPLMLNSRWELGGDQEKYEVLAAIRQSYNPEYKVDIRGAEHQLPSQIGRSEGFTQLSYRRASPASPTVIIVSEPALYRRLPH